MAHPASPLTPFARAIREALEASLTPAVADALLRRALEAAGRPGVPEDVGEFRAFVEGPLSTEMARVLDPAGVSLALARLGDVLWMATSDVRALSVARAWSDRPKRAVTAPALVPQSGAHPRLGVREPQPRRSSMPPPRESGVAPAPRALFEPTSLLVVTLDRALIAQATNEVGGRVPILAVATPVDLARAVSSAGERPVVLVDTTLPSIDLPTFVGLAPILPPDARVVLWGASPHQLPRLATKFPRMVGWLASGESREPGRLALSLAR
ncbi:MAG: hypothetical protein U0234_02460 [Sandaracinus sp.]